MQEQQTEQYTYVNTLHKVYKYTVQYTYTLHIYVHYTVYVHTYTLYSIH